MKTNNTADLEKKMWYRLLKVVYLGAYICSEIGILFGIIISLSVLGSESQMHEVIFTLILAGILIVPGFFYLVRHIFFYILTGNWGTKNK